jgi:hypothetical protein
MQVIRVKLLVGTVALIGILGGFFFLRLFNNSKSSDVVVEQLLTIGDHQLQEAVFLGEGFQTYAHPRYGFSFEFPEEFIIQTYTEAAGETIVVQKENNNELPVEDKVGLQIYITAFNEEEVLTAERILQDVPGAVIENPQHVIINPLAPANGEVTALLFWSEDPAVGRTREIWFTDNNYLYEVTAYAHVDEWLARVISSWRFNNYVN